MKLVFISHLAKNMLLFRSELLKSLSESGHEVIVVCPKDSDCVKFQNLGVEYIEWSFNRQGGVLNALRALWELIHLFKQRKPDRVISYMIQPIILSSVASYFVKIDLTSVFTGLGTLFIQRVKFKHKVRFLVVRNVLKVLLKQSKRVIVLNSDDFKELSSLCNFKKIHRLPGEGIDLERFKIENLDKSKLEEYQMLLKPNGEKVILYLGRFIKEKGIHDFYEIAKEFAEKKDFHFVAVGECDFGNPSSLVLSELEELKKVATVIEWSEHIPEILKNTDLMLYPSQREGFPVGAMEALASCIPVIGYNVPGTKDALKDEPRFIVRGLNEMKENIEIILNQNFFVDYRYLADCFNLKNILKMYIDMLDISEKFK